MSFSKNVKLNIFGLKYDAQNYLKTLFCSEFNFKQESKIKILPSKRNSKIYAQLPKMPIFLYKNS